MDYEKKTDVIALTEKVMRTTREYESQLELETPDEENYQLEYILAAGNGKDRKVSAVAALPYDDVFMVFDFLPGQENVDLSSASLPGGMFDCDLFLFENLKSGWHIEAMSIAAHRTIAAALDDGENFSQDGFKVYQDYCDSMGITKEFLNAHADLEGLDILVMSEHTSVREAKASVLGKLHDAQPTVASPKRPGVKSHDQEL